MHEKSRSYRRRLRHAGIKAGTEGTAPARDLRQRVEASNGWEFGGEFGEALERARKRMDGPQTLLLKAPAQPTDLSGPPMVSDRRFRN